jgi:hypothetical protein
MDDLGSRIVTALGEPAARELLDVLTRPDADRAALIGRLHQRDDTTWLAELFMDIDSDPDDITRLKLIGALGCPHVTTRLYSMRAVSGVRTLRRGRQSQRPMRILLGETGPRGLHRQGPNGRRCSPKTVELKDEAPG